MVVCNGFNTFVLRKKNKSFIEKKRKNNYITIKQPWEEHMNTGKPPK